MKNENFDGFFKYHVGGDDKLQINFAWPYSYNMNRSLS